MTSLTLSPPSTPLYTQLPQFRVFQCLPKHLIQQFLGTFHSSSLSGLRLHQKTSISSMRTSICTAYTATLLLALLLILPVLTPARQIEGSHSRHRHRRSRGHAVGMAVFMKPSLYRDGEEAKLREETVQVAGSSLPDCSHACGSCSPCRLVMVSFVCSSLEEAETCPMAYKCMCHSKSYPVP